MEWGLNGVQLSYEHGSAYVASGSGNWLDRIIDALADNDVFKYDFYLERDNAYSKSYTNPARNGYQFTLNIINVLRTNDDLSDNIDILHLAEKPKSAVEYCYNKNKRNITGNVESTNWYLPAIDEIEEIVMSEYTGGEKTYIRFLDFQGKYYWSSMPSYERNKIDYYIWPYSTTGEFYVDDVDRARATKVVYATQYSNVPSGVVEKDASGNINYSNTLYIRNLDFITPRIVFTRTTERGKEGLYYEGENQAFYEDGNDSRSQKNRIRCVRKQ